MSMSRETVSELLYGQEKGRRFTQDSPILPDVWMKYAAHPDAKVDLLLTPHENQEASADSPALLAAKLHKSLKLRSARSGGFYRSDETDHEIAVNQTSVAVRLWFDELIRVVLPMSSWWRLNFSATSSARGVNKQREGLFDALKTVAGRRRLASKMTRSSDAAGKDIPPSFRWLVVVAGTIAAANEAESPAGRRDRTDTLLWPLPTDAKLRRAHFEKLIAAFAKLMARVNLIDAKPALVHLVSRNRPAQSCLFHSVPAVKADAAMTLFKIDCSGITWAIADSGIDARHPAFRRRSESGEPVRLRSSGDWTDASRVIESYDFTIIRKVLSTQEEDVSALPPKLKRLVKREPEIRQQIRNRLMNGREIDWPLLLPFIRIPHNKDYAAPLHDHGTHVGGIIAADWRPEDAGASVLGAPLRGMCPTVNLVDLRILDKDGLGDEFTVMAALQFVRYLNADREIMATHGVNLSLSIRHDVANYACGRTPVCEECDRLIASGVVVVAAAGNDGFRPDSTSSMGSGYQDISITDPGNAPRVITVGATHRDMPHTYGVSYFSSRGPTGDGRLKPDLVAPGEKIDSAGLDGSIARKDGTSMAAPHVSGAAALLLARHREFIKQPDRIKEVLCGSATDLGRESYFQGRGMLDVLRALQTV